IACARLSAIGSCFCWMLAFWVEKSAEIRCAPKKTRGPTPTMRKPTLIYQRRLCIEDRPAPVDGAPTSRVTARQDQLCALPVVTETSQTLASHVPLAWGDAPSVTTGTLELCRNHG